MSATAQIADQTKAEAGLTKSAMKNTQSKQRRSSARKVVISDNPANQTVKGQTIRSSLNSTI